MVILNGWHRVLRRQGSKEKDIVILDQGPIYLLTELYLFGPRVLASRTAERWWAGMYKQWADALDLVIWLDAADKVLAERIRMRDQWHIVKDESDEGISEFLAQFRTAYDKVISMLSANSPGLRLLCLDTGEEALAETMNRVLAACSAGEGHRGTGCGTPASEG
jgi:thymidylate kinase